MIKKILWFVLVHAFSLFLVSYVLGAENFSVTSQNNTTFLNFIAFISVGMTIGILNAIIRPILSLISLPLIIITFGLFITVINAVILWFTEYLFTHIFNSFGIVFFIGGENHNFLSYVIGAICLSVIHSVLHFFKK